MAEESKTGFWWQYAIACFFPTKYGELLKKTKRAFIGYISVLILLLVLVETVIPIAAWDVSVGGLRNLFLNRLPAFSIKNGEFQSESPLSFTIGGVFRVEADSSKESFTSEDLEEEYIQEILIGKKNILVKTTSGNQSISLSQLGSVTITNQTLADTLPAIYPFLVVYLLLIILIKAAEYLLAAFGYALICRGSVRTPEGRVVSLSDAFHISVYAKTLFAVITSANVALGYLINSTVLIVVAVFVTMGFIIRAEHSVLKPKLSN